MSFKYTNNFYKHFIIRLLDRGNKDLEALMVTDAFNDKCAIFIKDKKALRDLIEQLIRHEEDFEC